MARAIRTRTKPPTAQVIAALPCSIWRGLPWASMMMIAPITKAKSAIAKAAWLSAVARLVKRPLTASIAVTPWLSLPAKGLARVRVDERAAAARGRVDASRAASAGEVGAPEAREDVHLADDVALDRGVQHPA